MTFELRLLVCVFLAFSTPNEAQKPILRKGFNNKNEQESLLNVDEEDVAGYTQRDSRYGQRGDSRLQYIYIDQKPTLKEEFEYDNQLTMLQPVDQIVHNRNKDKYDNVYEKRDTHRYTQGNANYEERNNNKFEVGNYSRFEDGYDIEAQNKSINKNFALLDGQSNEYDSKKPQSYLSYLESNVNRQDNTKVFDDIKYYLRSGVWKSCGKKAAEVCRKACEEAIKRGCHSPSCKSKMKKRMQKECKTSCKDRFGVEAKVEKGKNDNGNKDIPQVTEHSQYLTMDYVDFNRS